MIDMCDGKLKLYSGVTETAVDWLWYPFIPYGKLTLLQGDPGCGKSTLMMNLIAAASSGNCSPDGRNSKSRFMSSVFRGRYQRHNQAPTVERWR